MRFDLDLSFGRTMKNNNWELLYPICGALVMLMLRNVCQKYIFTKIGLRLGLKQIEVKKAPHNAVLEKAYSVSKKWKLDRVRGLAKQLDVSEEEVESWLKLRSAQDRPSVLTKFSESFWRCCYYTSIWTGAILIVWDKPWFWDLDQCWIDIENQTVTRNVWWHLMITLSFYLSELMGLYFDVKRKDFWPMFIHHVTSIVVLFFVWKCHLFRINMVALVLFDCSDILLELSKIMVYLGHDRTSFVTFFTFLFVWVMTRLGYFPFWVVKSCVQDAPRILPFARDYSLYYVLVTLNFIFVILNCIWTFFILKIARDMLFTDKPCRDSRSDSDDNL
ncbi:hypothetical protein MTP99_006385 [Tenebrio molitor]|nr:hypothetical protein MTP99_006385 [Tenebrio molitor]